MTALDDAMHWLRAGDPARAVPALRAVARQRPTDANIWHDLGLACLECDMLPEAIGALRRSLALRPDFADSQLRLGIALERSQAFAEALAAYRAAAALDSRLLDAQFRAGQLLESLGQVEAAAASFRRVANLAGAKSLQGRMAAARGYLLQGDYPAAGRCFRAALSGAPGNVMALQGLGQVLADTGQFDAARTVLEKAVTLAPDMAGIYYDIVRCRKIGAADAELMAQMRAALTRPGLGAVDRARLHLALGKAEEDCGRLEQAMAAYAAAAALRDGFAPFDGAAFAARVDRLMAAFPPGSVPGAAVPAAPILIIGLPRSGTTLVEQILSAHPAVAGAGELSFWNERGVAWEAAAAPARAQLLHEAGGAYLTMLGRLAGGRARVTDKMPLNFQWAGLVLRAIPGATLVHCRRHRVATALSIHKTHFNPRFAFPTGGAALAAYCRLYERLMAHWRAVLPPARLVEIEYETLVQNPEPTIRALLAACGLTWHDACLHPERNGRAVNTPSKWQARQPIYTASVDGWRRFEPWLAALGV